jgi:peptidoglycan/LPS O-acetylase OafA/YrhL
VIARFVVLHFRHAAGHAFFATAALGFGLTLVLAWASFRWFETPFIRLKDRLTREPERAEDGTPAAISGRTALDAVA